MRQMSGQQRGISRFREAAEQVPWLQDYNTVLVFPDDRVEPSGARRDEQQ
jgi:hypothetical protein